MPLNTCRTRAGFTLVEMMMVVVIIGMMAIISVPRIGTTVARSRISALEVVVVSDLERAFALATRTRRPITVTYDSSTKQLLTKDRAAGTTLSARYLGKIAELSVTSVTLAPSKGITIFPTGLADTTLSVTIANGSFSRLVRSTIAGQIVRQ
jgi:prepilin-type N-terminal cleavage/methylation domain-containing protein